MQPSEIAARLLGRSRWAASPPSQNFSHYLGLAVVLRGEGRNDLADQLVEAVKPPPPTWGLGTTK